MWDFQLGEVDATNNPIGLSTDRYRNHKMNYRTEQLMEINQQNHAVVIEPSTIE